jgi:hypothetical protein
MNIGDLIPAPRYSMVHARHVNAPQEIVWDALHHTTLSAMPLTLVLETLRNPRRGIVRPPSSRSAMSFLDAMPIPVLFSTSPCLVVAGGIGQPWKLRGVNTPRELCSYALLNWSEPGWVKMAVEFTITSTSGRTTIRTETRVVATDQASDRAFSRYWLLIWPAASLIRNEVLRVVGRQAERMVKYGGRPGP